MKLSTQLTLAIVGVVFVAATALGFFTYRGVEDAILPGQLERAEMRAQLLANDIATFVEGSRADLLGFRSTALQGIVRASANGGTDPASGTRLAQWRAQLAGRLAAELAAKPAYAEFRLIGVADEGREIVRVDRLGPKGAIRIVEDDQLQQKGDRGYFEDAIGLGPSDVYVAPIALNREHGVVAVPHEPVLRTAIAVVGADGSPFGILIVNVDMRKIFETVSQAATDGQRVYVVNDHGDFLVHPNTSREFGFDLGKSFRWQDEFPGFAALLGSAVGGIGVIDDVSRARVGMVMSSIQLAGSPRIAVLETIPYPVLVAPAAAAKRWSLAVGALASFGALLLALLVGRSLTRPLGQMTAAVEGFSRGSQMRIPTETRGEIGTFARAFARMVDEVRSKTAALEAEVAAHRRTEAELAQHADRERLYSAAVESSVDAIITKTLDGVVTGWNPAAERLFGFTAAEMIGLNIETIIPGERRTEQQAILGMIRRGETVKHHQTVRLTKDGKEIDVSLSISPIKSPAGAVIGACKIARDVTEQKLAEEKFHLAVEASPSGILMTDLAGHIVMVNSEIEKLFGYPRDELIGRPVEDLLPEGLRAAHLGSRSQYLAAPKTRRIGASGDLFGRRKDGTEFPVEVGLNPIQARESLLILSVIIDITERKRLDRMKDEFVSTVSHELRTPLTSIAGSLGLLLGTAGDGLPESARRLLSIAHSNSRRLGKLVNDILDIEKLESGQVGFTFKLTAVRPLIEQAVEASLGYADTYLVHLRHEIAAEEDVWVDPDRFSQVLANLISNAIKFSPPDGEVVVATERRDNVLRLTVRDQGSGIPPEFRSRIFGKFAQADGTNTKKTGGTGLGLSIVKEIVARLGGEVGFHDAPGGGTIFYVDLPASVAAARGARAASGRAETGDIKTAAIALGGGVSARSRYS